MAMTLPPTRDPGADIGRPEDTGSGRDMPPDCTSAVSSSILHGVGAYKEGVTEKEEAVYLCMFESV